MVRRILSDSQWARVALAVLPGKDGDPGRSARQTIGNSSKPLSCGLLAPSGRHGATLPDEFGLWNSEQVNITQGYQNQLPSPSRIFPAGAFLRPKVT